MSGLTIYAELEQRSPEWLAARCGLVTASTLGRLITASAPGADAYECPECSAPSSEPCISLRGGTPIKTMHSGRVATATSAASTAPPVLTVADNDTSRGLLATLAAERITGNVEDIPMTSDMWRGVDSEPFARGCYAENYAPVTEVGFMVRDFGTYRIGYSPDGLVDDDGLIEIKAPRAKTHVQTILADEVPAHYMAQCQTGMLVSGRKWCDFISFNGGMHLWPKRVHFDPAWAEVIQSAALSAEQAITGTVDRYQAAVKHLPMTQPLPNLDEMVIPA